MYRFFVEQTACMGDTIPITGEDLNHMKHVLRLKVGEQVTVSDGSEREYVCEIEKYIENAAQLRVIDILDSNAELPTQITLYQGYPKGDKLELIIQKAVELGAVRIVPVMTRRSVVKLDAKKVAKKVARWQQIAESAAKQSKRMLIPEIHEVMTYKEALAFAGHLDVKLIPYELAKGMKETREILNELRPGQSIGIFIGPEGGFEEEEVSKALEVGAHAITLGRRILRTETAGLAILSVLMFQLENE